MKREFKNKRILNTGKKVLNIPSSLSFRALWKYFSRLALLSRKLFTDMLVAEFFILLSIMDRITESYPVSNSLCKVPISDFLLNKETIQ